VTLPGRVDAHHVGIGRELTGPHAEHHPPHGLMVELHHPVGQHEGVVVRQRGDTGAEADALGALGGGGDEHLGRADRLPACRVVLAHPNLFVAEVVEMGDEFEVAPEHEGGAGCEVPVERGEEDAEAGWLLYVGHRSPSSGDEWGSVTQER
jgi:hypothetical protein